MGETLVYVGLLLSIIVGVLSLVTKERVLHFTGGWLCLMTSNVAAVVQNDHTVIFFTMIAAGTYLLICSYRGE